MNKIKVMACIQSLNDGGAQKIVLNNLEGFSSDSNVQFELFVGNHTRKSQYEKYVMKNKLKVHYLISRPVGLFFSLLSKLHVKINTDGLQKRLWERAINKYSPDIIHLHIAVLLDKLLEPIQNTNIPIRFLTLHSAPYRQSDKILKKIKTAFDTEKFIALCLTNDMIEEAKEHYGVKKYELLRNGTNFKAIQEKIISKEAARRVLNIPNDAFIISTVGRLEPVKNYTFLIDIFNALLKKRKSALLVFAGEGSQKEELQRKCEQYGILDKVIFLGNLTNVVPVYCASDVFALTSLSEASSLVLLELQQTDGRAVISAGVPSESIVTDKIQKMSEKATIDMWVDALLNESFVGKSVCDKKEYDYEYANKRLLEIYLKYWNEYNAK